MEDFGKQSDLIELLRHNVKKGQKPIAFVVGSGLTRDSVPGVKWYVDQIRSAFVDAVRERFDHEVVGPTQAEMYQQATLFVKRNRGQGWLNLLIRLGVLRALREYEDLPVGMVAEFLRDDRRLKRYEDNAGYWKLGAGVEHFGYLLGLIPQGRRGPVITTNFDPLIKIATRDAGQAVSIQWLESDGKIYRPDVDEEVEIVHVHGFYRNSTTLNTQSQLVRARPRLRGSLKERLRGHHVLVCGYGGWRDCFTSALLQLIEEDQSLDMEISWAWHGPSGDEAPIVEKLSELDAISQFEKIDVNSLFPKVAEAL